MKKNLCSVFLLLVLVLASCVNSFMSNSDEDGPRYNLSPAWRTGEVIALSGWAAPFIADKYGYFNERGGTIWSLKPVYFDDSGAWSRMVKVDLDTGELVWRTEKAEVDFFDQGAKIGPYIYVPLLEKGILNVYRDGDGSLAATVMLGKINAEAEANGIGGKYMAVYEGYLYWGNKGAYYTKQTNALIRFDTRLVDFSQSPQTVQHITPELFWRRENNGGINGNILVENGILYLLTRSPFYWDKSTTAVLASLDALSGQVFWEKELDSATGGASFSLVINGDNLHVIDSTPSCHDKRTGETIYDWDEKDFFEFTNGGGTKVSLYNNRLYYTGGADIVDRALIDQGYDPAQVKNVICLNPDTGKRVWGDLIPNSFGMRTNPVVHNGKVFVVSGNGIRVYDADNGKLLGVNRDYSNCGATNVLFYNGNIIFPDEISHNSVWLVAVKAD